ncbi:MAG: HAMP domain-containing histidine kinase [Clostridia bacterium]|nr:HAMP domain-containing histidine kinase [Clostridia bacterium]
MNGEKSDRMGLMLYSISRFLLFFVLVAFAVSCCMMLFLSSMMRAMDLTLTSQDIQQAAKLTMGNVLLITAIFAVIDRQRRKWMVERPVRMIVEAAERIEKGDFSVRIASMAYLDSRSGFGDIARCFNRMAEELSGTETLRTDFISNVSHEIKTPLAVIKNYATMLERGDLSEAQRAQYARAIGDTARRLASLITNILKLGKLENQQIFPAFTEYDLSEQLCACLLEFEDVWEKKRLEIETDIEDGVTAWGDAELLSLVWNNLFSNAIKFTDDGGRVSLSVKRSGNDAVVTVADTGCGFDAGVGAHIFEKFYQGDTSRATQGNGLGLALVRRVVDIHGGEIAVSSTPGRGSAFTVRIRRHADGKA